MPARRRAEKFNDWVEGNAPAPLDDARILEVVGALRSVESPAPRADFAADLRARLMAEADTVLVRTERNLTLPASLAPTQRRHHRRLAVAASALAVVGATTSVSMAAQHALPGDALYPIKRALESAQTGLASGDAKTEEMLSHASSRLVEATALAQKGSAESNAEVVGTLDDFAAQAQAAADQALASHDPSQITQLREFTASSMQTLQVLDSVTPADAHAAIAAAARLVTSIDSRALTQCPICGGAVIDLPPIFLASAAAHGGQVARQVATSRPGTSASHPVVKAPSLAVPEVKAPASTTATDNQPEASDQASQQPLIADGKTTGSDPLTALGGALTGSNTPNSTSTSNPLAPVTTPLLTVVQDTVDGTLGSLTSP